jgi:hypothetical protein
MHSAITILTCLIIIGCNSKPSTNNSLSQDEYDVYSAIINEKLNRYNKNHIEGKDTVQFIVVYHQTIKGSVIASNDSNNSFVKYIPLSELYELASELSKVAKDTLDINPDKINAPVKMIYKENIDERNRYYYTQGVKLYSRVGFNVNRNKALVYCALWIEWGGEIMYLLKKEKGKWIVVDGLSNSTGHPELLSSIKLTKPTVGTPVPVPDARIQYADSTSIIK